MLILSVLKKDVTLNSLLFFSIIGLGVSFLAGSINIICTHIFAPEKSQIISILSYVGAAIIIVAIILIINVFIPVNEHLILSFGIILIISLLLLALSYKVTVKLYEKIDIN